MPRRTENDGRSLGPVNCQCSAAPAATPVQCTRVPEDMRNAVALDQGGCTFGEVELSCASNQLVHMLQLASDFIRQCIK